MSLVNTYKTVKPSVVAIVARVSRNVDFPDIIGTGFICHPDGLIMTNNHVIKAIKNVPRPKDMDPDEWPVDVAMLINTNMGMATLTMPVKAVMTFSLSEEPTYGSQTPDVGIVRVAYKNLPTLEIDTKPDYAEGQDLAIAGFPLGTLLLRQGGKMDHIGPTLKRSIVSAVLPFPSKGLPHALLMHTMSQGGSSGSPVFDPESGKVLGILYAGMEEPRSVPVKELPLPYRVPTDLTYAVPSHFMASVLEKVLESKEYKDHNPGEVVDFPKFLDDSLKDAKAGKLKQPKLVTLPESEIVFPRSTDRIREDNKSTYKQ